MLFYAQHIDKLEYIDASGVWLNMLIIKILEELKMKRNDPYGINKMKQAKKESQEKAERRDEVFEDLVAEIKNISSKLEKIEKKMSKEKQEA